MKILSPVSIVVSDKGELVSPTHPLPVYEDPNPIPLAVLGHMRGDCANPPQICEVWPDYSRSHCWEEGGYSWHMVMRVEGQKDTDLKSTVFSPLC